MKPHRHFLLAGSLSLCSLISYPVYAQIVPDGTLGTERSTVVPNLTIRGIPSDRIDGGAVRGINLFHSFLDFNVSAGRGVYFSNPVGVQNILSRVTGNNPSNILGRLGVLGNANLYLLNPNGIVFGPNASLDVTGSFVASTASAIRLGNGVYSATAPQTSTLLAVQPDALFLNALGNQRGDIRNDGNLAVPPGQSLTLFGGTVTSTGTLQAAGGTVQMLGDRVALLDRALIDVSSPTGGGIVRIGGDFQGKGNLPKAIATYIGSDATVRADGAGTSNGGQIVVWSNTSTKVFGTLTARGGELGGNGGLVETSSAGYLDTYGASIDASAPKGLPGNWLLDPRNIIITASPSTNGTFSGGNPDIFTPTGDDAIVSTADIIARLTTGTNVTIATTPPAGGLDTGTQAGNITLASPLNFNGIGVGKTLTLNASNNININGAINDSALLTIDRLNLVLNADSDRNGAGSVSINQPISTQGGTITAYGAAPAGALVVSGISVNANLNSQGGNISLTGNSGTTSGIFSPALISSGGGRIDLTGTSSGTGDFARGIAVNEIDSGGGAIALIGTSGTAEGIVNFGSINSGGGAISLTGVSNGTGTFARGIATVGVVNSQGGNITLAGSGANSGVINFAPIASGSGAITLSSDNPTIISSVAGTGDLTIQPQTAGLNLVLGGTGDASTTFLNTAELNNLASGFRSITIGAANGSGAITLADNITRNEPLMLRSPFGAVNLNGFTLSAAQGLTLGNIVGTGSPVTLSSTGNITAGNITNPGGNIKLQGAGLSLGTVSTAPTLFGQSPAGLNAGDIQLTVTGGNITAFRIDASSSRNDDGNAGKGGNIQLDAPNGSVTVISGILSFSQVGRDPGGNFLGNTSNAGSITVNAANGIQVGDAIDQFGGSLGAFNASTFTFNGVAGNAGDIKLTSSQGSIVIGSGGVFTNSTAFISGTAGRGGNIRLEAGNRIDVFATVETATKSPDGSTGNSGDIFLSGDNGITTQNITSETQGLTSNSGSIVLYSLNGAIDTRAGEIRTTTKGGNGGFIGIWGLTGVSVRDISSYSNGGYFSSFPNFEGNSGDIFLYSGAIVRVEGGTISSPVFGTGKGGNINVRAKTFELDNSTLYTSTFGSGSAGGIFIEATGGVRFDNQSLVRTGPESDTATGRGGNIEVKTNSFTLTNNSQLSTDTNGVGNAGSILIQANQVDITNNSKLTTSTSGSGNAGNIDISSSNVTVGNSSIFSGVDPTFSGSDPNQTGAAGTINIQGDQILVQNNSTLSTKTTSTNSPAGQIFLTGQQQVTIDNSNVSSQSTGRSTSFPYGVVSIHAPLGSVSLDRATLSVQNDGLGISGDIDITARDRINIKNSQLSANGNVGYLFIGQRPEWVEDTPTPYPKSPEGFEEPTPYSYYNRPVPQLLPTSVEIENSTITSSNSTISGSKDSGVIGIRASGTILIKNSTIDNTTTGTGFGGYILIDAPLSVTLDQNSIVKAESTGKDNPISSGNAGNLSISTQKLNITNQSGVTVSNQGSGDAGNIDISATNVTLDQSSFIRAESAIGKFNGQITLGKPESKLQSLKISNNSTISASTKDGQGGTLAINVFGNTDLTSGSKLTTSATGSGKAGNLTLTTGTLDATGSEISTTSTGGQGGNLDVTATNSITLGNTNITATALKDAGKLKISTGTLTTAGSEISASSVNGTGGDLFIGSDLVKLTSSTIAAKATGLGTAGQLTLFTKNLFLDNGVISVSTVDGVGASRNPIVIDLKSRRFASTFNLDEALKNPTFVVLRDTRGGQLLIQATDSVTLKNSSRLEATATGTGEAGDLAIVTPKLTASGGSQITVDSNSGRPGNLVAVAEGIVLDNSRLTANNQSYVRTASNSATGGNIIVYVGPPLPLSEGQVSASAFFKKGITNTSGNTIEIKNGGVISTSTVSGQAGSIFIQGNNLVIKDDRDRGIPDRDRSRIESISSGLGSAGKIDIKLSNLLASSGGVISASAEGGGSGGQIDITAKYIFLTNSSLIQSLVSKGEGDGGNITIRVGSQFIALNDSDILATAIDGNGGNIEIKPALGIRSIAFIADVFAPVQPNSGNLERYRNNGQVNISASSDFGVSGTVSTPDFSFLQNNLTELANQLAGAERLISDRCIANRNQSQGSFVVTGTGGLPASPYDAIRGSYSASGVQQLNGQSVEMSVPAVSIKPDWQPGQPIQEASGMTITPDGKIVLGTDSQLSSVQDTWNFICRHSSVPPRSAKLVANN